MVSAILLSDIFELVQALKKLARNMFLISEYELCGMKINFVYLHKINSNSRSNCNPFQTLLLTALAKSIFFYTK